MVIGDVKAVLLTLLLLVPGYIWLRMFMVFRKQPAVDGMSGFLNCFLTSCVLAAFWFPHWGARALSASTHLETASSEEVWLVLSLLLVWPALSGLGLGWLFHRRPLREALMRKGLYVVHPVDTAWDYAFGLHRDGADIKVHLDDGTTITGRYGEKSLVSTDPTERDIFLEDVFIIRRGKPMFPEPRVSLYLKSNSIKKIEFLTRRF